MAIMALEGLLYIFGRFNSRDVDTKILFRNNTGDKAEWEGGLSAFSVHTLSRFLKNQVINVILKNSICLLI